MSAHAPTDDGLEPASLVQLLIQRLRTEIFSGALAPGERLVEEQFTRRFGTSRAPLREALRLLGQQGLVEHLPRRGVRVVELSSRDIGELFDLRDVLEQFAVRTALGRSDPPPPAALSGLRAAVEDMDRTTADAAGQAIAHREFHLALVALPGHVHLQRAYEPILSQLQLYMATNMRREAQVRPADEGARRHRRLYEAVAGGEIEPALAELARHGARTFLAPELGAAARPGTPGPVAD